MPRIARLAIVLSLFAGVLSTLAHDAAAAVVILANRAPTAIRFETRPGSDAKWRPQVISPGDCIALPLESSEKLTIRSDEVGLYQLAAYGVYYFGSKPTGLGPQLAGKVELREIGLATEAPVARQQARALVGAQVDLGGEALAENDREVEARRTITVAIYVDDEEPAVAPVWRKRLEDRVAAASKILERSCGMKLAIKSFGRWETNDAVHDFELSLREFERKVRPGDAQLAIGFTNQYQITRGRTHLGGTHGPLHTHILLREWSQHVNEPERLELLVHEIAHFLGAVHSPESHSVMRPLLGDRQARARAFRIAIDPINALAMSVVGEEIRDRGVASFSQLSEPSRARLEAVYTTLAQALPNDPAAAAYLRYVQRQHLAP